MPQFDTSTFASQIFWLVVTFVTLYLVMWRVVAPRIAEVLESRRRRIEMNLEKAETLKKDAASARAAYEKALTGAHNEARAIVAEAGARIAEAAALQEAEAGKRLTQRIAESEAGIARALEAAMTDVRQAAAEAAALAAARLLDEAPDAAEAQRAVAAVLKTGG